MRAHLDAFTKRDLPAMLATLSSDAVFVTGTTLVAPADFDEFFGWAMRELDPVMGIRNLVVDGGRVACEFLESVTLDGERRHLNRSAFFTIVDELITAVKVYDERE